MTEPVNTVERPKGAPWSFADAAKWLGISHRHLVRISDAGWLRDVRYGRRRMIPAAELERFAAEGCSPDASIQGNDVSK